MTENTVQLGFELPEGYRRTFVLEDEPLRLRLEFEPSKVTVTADGVRRGHDSMHMDWIHECMEMVRREAGV